MNADDDYHVKYEEETSDISGQYDPLLGWNQDRYHKLRIKIITRNNDHTNVYILDHNGNLYYILESQLHDINLKSRGIIFK